MPAHKTQNHPSNALHYAAIPIKRCQLEISTTAPILKQFHYFRQNILVNICVQFHFQFIFVGQVDYQLKHMISDIFIGELAFDTTPLDLSV